MNTRILKFRYFNSEKFMYSDDFSFSSLQSLALFFESALKYSDGKIQQFTGLTDKNGKEIYEGDIVKMLDGTNYEVKFYMEDNELNCSGYMFSSFVVEVIGNVFQKPLDNH